MKIQRTKIEGEIKGLEVIIRLIGVQSGHVYQILCRFKATDLDSVQDEFDGAMNYIKSQQEAK